MVSFRVLALLAAAAVVTGQDVSTLEPCGVGAIRLCSVSSLTKSVHLFLSRAQASALLETIEMARGRLPRRVALNHSELALRASPVHSLLPDQQG